MKNSQRMSLRTSQRRLPTLVAVGTSLAALPAMAIELGDLTVHSSLGQPLRASIAYALAPTEQLFSDCISLRSGTTASGLPNVGRATFSVANGVIKLTGNTAIREPMVAAHVMVNCPYTANINREYMLFINPQAPTYEAASVVEQVTTPVAQTVVSVAPVRRQSTARASVEKNIDSAAPYQVRPGDSLSLIAQRIENRNVGLWTAVDTIFAANPEAFIDNDPNKLQAGVWLTIPNFGNSEAVLANEVAVEVTTTDLEPGNIFVDDDPYVADSAATEVVVIPDTELAGPDTASTSPNVVTAVVATNAATVTSTTATSAQDSSSMLWWSWLAGGGVTIALILMLFGRRTRTPQEPAAAVALNANPGRRITDRTDRTDTEQLATVDFGLGHELPAAENQLLDADLVLGTGLSNAADMDGSKLDIEVPFDEVPVDRSHSILENEIMPIDDETAVLKLASVTELDVTSHLPTQHDTIGDDEDTGINEILTEDMMIEENTVAMPAAENDEKTVEMPVKSGKAG